MTATPPNASPAVGAVQPTADTIAVGDYIIIQRQKYTKLHRFSSLTSTAQLGKDLLELGAIVGQPYDSTFRMVTKETPKGRRNDKKTVLLEPVTATEAANIACVADDVLVAGASGADNRNIQDNGRSQALDADAIGRLRDECSSATEIVSQIVGNSATFRSKTEYSQEKYVRKKEKKYYEYVQIRRPSVRLITDVMFRQCPEKILGVRMDTLSQLISYSGISAVGNHLLYESGTNGLLPAALMNSIGAGTEGRLVHMHPGNVPQKQALFALNLGAEQLERCVSVNVYSVLRQFYQAKETNGSVEAADSTVGDKRKLEERDAEDEPAEKQAKVAETEEVVAGETKTEETVVVPAATAAAAAATTDVKRHQWQIDNDRACDLLASKLDSLTICAKEYPLEIVQALLPFVRPSRPFVVFSASREILSELYVALKSAGNVTNLRITSNWLRMLQVLPNRTHPDVNMSGSGGFLLTGYTVQ